jgi:hypothetical protein
MQALEAKAKRQRKFILSDRMHQLIIIVFILLCVLKII